MRHQRATGMSRREFLGGVTAAGTAGFLGLHPRAVAAEPPPETATIRLPHAPAVCTAPLYVAEELLRSEGFIEVHYVKSKLGRMAQVATEQADIGITFAGPILLQLDTGDPLVVSGVHPGCFELFGTGQVHTLRDLKGKTVGVVQMESSQHVFLASMAAYVGLDPRQDIKWVVIPRDEAAQLLSAGKIDAYMGFAPEPQELRAKKIGHVVVNSAVDRPWSQYFCCLVTAHREFVRKHPVTTNWRFLNELKKELKG